MTSPNPSSKTPPLHGQSLAAMPLSMPSIFPLTRPVWNTRTEYSDVALEALYDALCQNIFGKLGVSVAVPNLKGIQ